MDFVDFVAFAWVVIVVNNDFKIADC